MARVCPKPCGRLATAAVFIAVGVVQLLVGVILLRSRYADLLSGADFLTSATNIVTGCLYGIAASVWENNSKRVTAKRTARKNTLAALLVSVIAVNTTAVIVLIMSEGNKLLSLPYFKISSRHSSIIFAKEVFASAYVTSVCSPIVCIVVALVALSGNCFQMYRTDNDVNRKRSIEKVENPFGWVFEQKSQPGPKVINDIVEASSSSNPESTTSENSMKRKSVIDVKNIQSPVHTWRKKRSRMVMNGNLSCKCSPFDEHHQNTDFMDGAHEGLIPRIKNSSMIKNRLEGAAINNNVSHLDRKGPTTTQAKISKIGFCPSPNDPGYIKVRSDSYTNAIEGNGLSYEARLKRKCMSVANKGTNTLPDLCMEEKSCGRSKSPKHVKSLHSSIGGPLTKSDLARVHKSSLGSLEMYHREVTEVDDPEIAMLKLHTLQELKERVKKTLPGRQVTVIQLANDESEDYDAHKKKEKGYIGQGKEKGYIGHAHHQEGMHVLKKSINERSTREIPEGSLYSQENWSPGEVFEPPSASKVAEFSQHEKLHMLPSVSRNSSQFSAKPLDLRTSKKIDSEMKETRGKLREKSVVRKSSLDIEIEKSLQETGIEVLPYDERKIGKVEQIYPNVASLKMHNKKRGLSRKMKSMGSINEVPSEERINGICVDRNSSHRFSRRATSSDENPKDIDENSNIKIHSSPSRTMLSESSALRKSRSFSPKGILKKMWSSAGPEAKLTVLDLIVDEDSLIGLSEEELLARTLRIRSLRKGVEERLKKENEMRSKMDDGQVTD